MRPDGLDPICPVHRLWLGLGDEVLPSDRVPQQVQEGGNVVEEVALHVAVGGHVVHEVDVLEGEGGEGRVGKGVHRADVLEQGDVGPDECRTQVSK